MHINPVKIPEDEEPRGRDRRASKNPIFVLLSFPQAKRVGNPSEKKDSGQAGMTNNGSLTYEPISK